MSLLYVHDRSKSISLAGLVGERLHAESKTVSLVLGKSERA
jgi:hypothetical protein